MRERHEPDQQFVERLEWQIATEARRRNRAAAPPSARWKLARVVAVMIVSMAFGAAAMGASYQREESWRQELLEADLNVRLQLAHKRVELAVEDLAAVQRRVDVGAAGREDQAGARMRLADAQTRVRLLELELEEVRASGRAPLGEVSSPVVDGRDFVAERLAAELQFATLQLELAEQEMTRARTRHDLGAIDTVELEALRLQYAEFERRVQSLRDRLDFRGDFVDGRLAGVEAELMVRIADTEGQALLARRRLELMQQDFERMRTRVDIGTESPAALGSYELALAEAEAQLRLTEVELEVLRLELEAQR